MNQNKSSIFILIMLIFTMGCNKIQIKNINYDIFDQGNLFLTENYNYQRNALSPFEIIPPIKLKYEDDFSGLPNGGFTLIDTILFFGTGKGYIFALNANNLSELGKKKLGASTTAPPTIYKNVLYQTFDNGDYGLIAYDISEGEIIWSIENNLTSSSPIVVEKKVYFQNSLGQVFCFNYFTGEIIWETDLECFGYNALAYDKGKIISTNQNGLVAAIEYTSGIELWNKKFDDHIFSNPVIFDEDVFVTTYNGYIYQINIENGILKNGKHLNIPLYHGATIENNHIYIPISNGEVKKFNKNNLIEIWSFKGSGPAASAVAVSENYIYFSTLGKTLYILDKNTGTALQEIKLEGRARSIPILSKDRLFIACEDDYVNVFATSE